MTDIRAIYPDLDESGSFWAPGDYGPLIRSLADEILIRVDDEDYSGDSRFLLKRDGRFGLLVFGWGSCSGCDALQACESYDDIARLRDDLENKIVWRDGAAAMLAYVTEKDWELEHAWHAKETRSFLTLAEKLLAQLAAS